MRIVLINVQSHDGNNIVPPLGVLYVAAQLLKDGHTVQVYDYDPDMQNFLGEIAEFEPEVIGFGFLTNSYQKARQLIEKTRHSIPGAVVVLGGIHCSSVPLETFMDMRPDYLVVGEGERVMSALCAKLEQDDIDGISRLKSLYHWQRGNPLYSGDAQLLENLDELPFPARHLLRFEKYLCLPGITRGYATERMTTIITSRGCHFSCSYCASHNIFGRRIRKRSVENVIEEIRNLVKRYGIKGFYLCDDLFTSDSVWTLSFCEALLKEPVKLAWACQSRVDTLSERLIKKMAASGCIQIDFGVESGSESTLKRLNKKAANHKAPALFRMLQSHGIRACATFIIGNPGETLDDIKETFDFANLLKADYTAFYYSTPYPGTELHKTAVERGWLENGTGYSEDWNHRQARYPLMDTGIGKERLGHIRKKMQNSFFIRNYFGLHNLRFYLSLLVTSILKPYETIRMIGGYLSTGRLDDLAEGLLKNYWRRVDLKTVKGLKN